MKKTLKKAVAVAMVACMSLAVMPMFASAYALTANISLDGTTATVSGTAEADKEVAIVVVECTHGDTTGSCPECAAADMIADAVYVDQVTADDSGAYSVDVSSLDASKQYTAFVGATGADAQVKATTDGDPVEPTPPPTPSEPPVEPEYTSIKYGDLDINGTIAVGDVIAIARFVGGVAVPTNEQALAADADGNGTIAVGDVIQVARVVGGVLGEDQLGAGNDSEFVPMDAADVYLNDSLVGSVANIEEGGDEPTGPNRPDISEALLTMSARPYTNAGCTETNTVFSEGTLTMTKDQTNMHNVLVWADPVATLTEDTTYTLSFKASISGGSPGNNWDGYSIRLRENGGSYNSHTIVQFYPAADGQTGIELGMGQDPVALVSGGTHQYDIVYNASSARIYCDGELVATNTIPFNTSYPLHAFDIANGNNDATGSIFTISEFAVFEGDIYA